MSATFQEGDRVVNDLGVHGVIKSIRDDTYEQKCRRADSRHGFYYHVEYANGKFDTYVPGYTLTLEQNMYHVNKI